MCYNPCFMSEETRSLWEIYDSEVPPWRRGRTILTCIAFFHFLLQCLLAIGLALSGNLDRIFFFGLAAVLFWLQFYFVWIGVRWLRWLWGAWNVATGFCLIIWAWRDLSAIERSEEHTSELQSRVDLVCRLLLEKKKKKQTV